MTPARRPARLPRGWLLILCALGAGSAGGQEPSQAAPTPTPTPTPAPAPATARVVLKTSVGDIVLAIEKQRAPVTAGNFLRYVDQKRLDGSTFYRALQLDEQGEYGLIQGGLRGNPKRVLKPIAHEPTTLTGLSHVDGAISMARADPGTATADFFIVIGDAISYDANPATGDPGYAVFGRVIDGMDVVRAILGQPRSADAGEGVMHGQMLAVPVRILSARRLE